MDTRDTQAFLPMHVGGSFEGHLAWPFVIEMEQTDNEYHNI